MEKDDEIKGEGNSLNFGARIYDARIGRWLSTDPLEKKYPGLNPYHFTANNPILYVDKDGRDYGVYINHDDKTIIVKATIHTVKGQDTEVANQGAAKWNAETGKWALYVGEGENTIAYTIEYQLTVKEHETTEQRDEAFFSDDSGEGNRLATIPGFFKGRKGNFGDTSYNATKDLGRGYNDMVVSLLEDAFSLETSAHEIGHVLGIYHPNGGLMSVAVEKNGGYERSTFGNTILGSYVSLMLSYAGAGKKTTYGDGRYRQTQRRSEYDMPTVHESGSAPDNFKTGTVYNDPTYIAKMFIQAVNTAF